MKDLFSKQSAEYAQFRPQYPKALFSYLAGLCAHHELAWDAGTGNGQAAAVLAEYFKRIIATDPSEKQLKCAKLKSNIEYKVAREGTSGVADHSVDLITVAQALHWFDLKLFSDEVKRVSRPDTWLAVWCYQLAQINPQVDAIVLHFYDNEVGPFWEPERKLVMDGYRGIALPFNEKPSPVFQMEAQWTLDLLLGYLRTWSSTQAAIEATGQDPVRAIERDLQKAWGDSKTSQPVVWDLVLRVGPVVSA